MKTQAFFVDLAERVFSTFLITFLPFVLTAPPGGVNYGRALGIALLAAAVSFFTTLVLWMTGSKLHLNPYFDLVYRAVITFVQSLLGYLVAAGVVSAFDFQWNRAVQLSAIAAGASLLKALIGLNNPKTLGASPILARDAVTLREHKPKSKLPLIG